MDNPKPNADSIDARPKSRTGYTPEIIVGAGYLLFFAALVVACVASLLIMYRPTASRQSAAPTPSQPVTPTPHILSTPAAGAPGVFADQFNDNSNAWGYIYNPASSLSVKDGELSLAPARSEGYAIATCAPCQKIDQPYYVQAEFSTDKPTDAGYGVIVRLYSYGSAFHLFFINTESRTYGFYFHVSNTWYMLAAGSSNAIRAFPAANVIGVYAKHSLLEFYMNGQFIDSFQDDGTSFDTTGIGFYVDGTAPTLFIDNLILHKFGGQ
jgi:hypothetical protein